MSSRITNTEVTRVLAECAGCDWRSVAGNALANAARHHDATGHEVRIEQELVIVYGKGPSLEELGQTTLDDVGAAP